MKKATIVSAGDAITAKLVEQAGFDGIWISGFEASARLGLADNGSITLTEMLNIAKPIVDAVKIPVWVDVDTGYGNFQRTVREFEKIGVAGVCVQDDEEGCKTNSLWGGKTPLMPMEEFGIKIKSLPLRWKRNIKIIARTEALIRGYGKKEAETRLRYYEKCGADILLPHARKEDDLIYFDIPYKESVGGTITHEEIFNRPFAIVPTKFPKYTNKQLFKMGYSIVIWANQTERVKIKSTREALKSLKDNDCALHIEENLSATLDEMKNLTPDF